MWAGQALPVPLQNPGFCPCQAASLQRHQVRLADQWHRRESSVMVSLAFALFCRHNVWAELTLRGLLKDLVCPHWCSGQLQVNQKLSSATTGHKLPASPVLTSPCHYLWGHTSSCACSLDSHSSASSLHTFLKIKNLFSLMMQVCLSLHAAPLPDDTVPLPEHAERRRYKQQ